MQSGSRSPTAESATTAVRSRRRTRARRWLLTHGLRVETLLALLLLAAGFVTAVVVFVGAIAALPTGPPPGGSGGATGGSGSVLGFGTVLLNGGLLLAIGVGIVLLVHAAAELWTIGRKGSELDLGDGFDLAYAGIRTVQTVAAAAFVGPILVGVALSRLGVIGDSPSNALLAVLFGSLLAMVASVCGHAIGRAVRSIE